MIIASTAVRALTPAIFSAAIVSPISHILDVSIVKTTASHDVFGSLSESAREFSINLPFAVSFSTLFCTIFSTNLFASEAARILAGMIIGTTLSICRDCAIIGNVPFESKVIFCLRDML